MNSGATTSLSQQQGPEKKDATDSSPLPLTIGDVMSIANDNRRINQFLHKRITALEQKMGRLESIVNMLPEAKTPPRVIRFDASDDDESIDDGSSSSDSDATTTTTNIIYDDDSPRHHHHHEQQHRRRHPPPPHQGKQPPSKKGEDRQRRHII